MAKTQNTNNFSPKPKKLGRADKKHTSNNKLSKIYKKEYKGQGKS